MNEEPHKKGKHGLSPIKAETAKFSKKRSSKTSGKSMKLKTIRMENLDEDNYEYEMEKRFTSMGSLGGTVANVNHFLLSFIDVWEALSSDLEHD